MIIRFFKKKQIIITGIALLCLFLNISNYAYSEAEKEQKSVLIINSYHQGFTWSKDITDGIISTFIKCSYNISTFVEYMDWKNYPTRENIQYLRDYYQYKYQDKKIDMLIATDDAALEFVLENRGIIFSDAPIVFCGINQNGVAEITAGYKNLTGVLEEVDPTDTINMALNINPSIKNVYVLFDNSESGMSAGEIVREKVKSMNKNLKTIPLNNLSYDELIRDVKSYDKDSIILVTTYYSDAEGRIVEFESASREVSRYSSVPVYHLYDMSLDDGAFGGVMTGGKIHGEGAAELAVRIFDGENPDDIPVKAPEITRKVLDYQQLKKFNISLDQIPKDIEIINKPFSFFETYKMLVLGVAAAFVILISFVCILLFYIKRIKAMRKNLSESHEKLTRTYEELADSEEELKQQFGEVLAVNERLGISEEKLTYLAYHDTLTGLLNKLSLYENASRDVFTSDAGTSALLFIDLDHFKYINDTMGHAFGDQLIIEVSKRLTLLLDDNCSIYRLSGDEFVIIIQNINVKNDAEAFAAQILNGFKEEFEVQKSILHVSLSIGIALYPEHGQNIEELLKHADIAMYKAKDTGRKSYVMYDQAMNEAFTERANIEKYLHTALQKNEFILYYQPQLELKSKKITGFEALLRWNSPELGFVSPVKFIKIAEDTQLIIPLGTWVLQTTCAFLKKLHNQGHTDLSASVNISILQLLQTDFDDLVIDTLDFYKLEPNNLELEITESILMESFDAVRPKLERLSKRGIKVALDDFGKGYSSLSYLKQLPISILKVDKSFVDSITDEIDKRALTGQIVTIGKSMGMCVIAEGVERQDQLEYLIKYECDKIQGYLYCEPMPEEEVIKQLEL